MTYKCHKCGMLSQHIGLCPKCNGEFDKICPTCNEEIEYCTCQSARIQKKGGPTKKKAKAGVLSR